LISVGFSLGSEVISCCGRLACDWCPNGWCFRSRYEVLFRAAEHASRALLVNLGVHTLVQTESKWLQPSIICGHSLVQLSRLSSVTLRARMTAVLKDVSKASPAPTPAPRSSLLVKERSWQLLGENSRGSRWAPFQACPFARAPPARARRVASYLRLCFNRVRRGQPIRSGLWPELLNLSFLTTTDTTNKRTQPDKRRAFFEFDHFRFRRWVLAVGGWVALVP
jgi:hypothetical protein